MPTGTAYARLIFVTGICLSCRRRWALHRLRDNLWYWRLDELDADPRWKVEADELICPEPDCNGLLAIDSLATVITEHGHRLRLRGIDTDPQ